MFFAPVIFDTLDSQIYGAHTCGKTCSRALIRTALRERGFMDRKVDVLEGDVENVHSGLDDRSESYNGIILFHAARSITNRVAQALCKNEL